ncbi:MAG: FHA domain-containing protein, partial [Planctomycetes bacterium]|nr:FHA domain-containing protein [Planctomycetota bacterium]
PLGLLLPDSVAGTGGRMDVHAVAAAARSVVVASPAEPRRAPRPPVESGGAAPAGLPRRLMLHVDGVGSFLLVRERCVTLGAAGGSHQPDVPLTMDGSIAPVTIERIDDDYFLIGSSGVTVNNVAVTRRLLRDGDRIALSARCHIRFAVPNAASTSAVLSIAGARIPGTDATRVVLLDRSLVLGPGAAAHVRADDLAEPAVVHVRDGRLFCNAAQEVTVNGHPIDRQAGLPLGAQLRLGPLSMVVKSA